MPSFPKTQKIPGYTRDFCKSTRRLLLTADQLFHRIRKGLPDAVCFLNCLWSLRKQLSGHSNMAPHLLLLCFFAKKLRFLISKVKRKTYKKYSFGIKFHSIFVIALGIKFRNVYIFFLFYFQNFGGSLPASSSASTRCTDIKKGTHPLLFFLPAMLIIIRKTIKKRSGI